MTIVHITDRDGKSHELEAKVGFKIMEIIRDAGLPIEAQCGGGCACATCHVYVDDEWYERLPEKGALEEEMLEFASELRKTSRLSCQIIFDQSLDGLKAELAPE